MVVPGLEHAQKGGTLAFVVGVLKMKIHLRKRTRREWVLLSTCAVIALTGIAVGYVYDTGTAAIIERIKEDGTLAHPFADASQCPLNTDLVFWPNSRSIPSMPSGISVCFVRTVAQQ
jgi:hypothetical protein